MAPARRKPAGKAPFFARGLGKPVRLEKPKAEFDVRLPLRVSSGRDTLELSVDYYYCREGSEGLCRIGSAEWIVPVELSAAAETAVVRLSHRAR